METGRSSQSIKCRKLFTRLRRIDLPHTFFGAKNFEELDIRLANSAGNAARNIGIKKIIYLGGIVPDSRNVSPHLVSRMKTGQALASHEIPVAEVRASILLATCSMSYLIVYFLAKRLPVMITPRWLNSLCAPIALEDAASFLAALVPRDIKGHEVFEIGSDIVRYRDLISLCGKSIRGVKSIIIPVPLFAVNLSSRWIQLITGIPNSVGEALAEGLKSDTIPSKNRFREVTGKDPIPIQSVLKTCGRNAKEKEMKFLSIVLLGTLKNYGMAATALLCDHLPSVIF